MFDGVLQQCGINPGTIERAVRSTRSGIRPIARGDIMAFRRLEGFLLTDGASRFASGLVEFATANWVPSTHHQIVIKANLQPRRCFLPALRSLDYKSPRPSTSSNELCRRQLLQALIEGAAHRFQGDYKFLKNRVLPESVKGDFEICIRHGLDVIFPGRGSNPDVPWNAFPLVAGQSTLEVTDSGLLLTATSWLAPELMRRVARGVLEGAIFHRLYSATEEGGLQPYIHSHRRYHIQLGVALWDRFIERQVSASASRKQQVQSFQEIARLPPEEFFKEIKRLLP